MTEVNPNMAKDKFYAARLKQSKAEQQAKELVQERPDPNAVKQEPSRMTGMQWTTVAKTETNGIKKSDYQLAEPDIDVASLSTTVSTNEVQLKEPVLPALISNVLNKETLLAKLKTATKERNSHNVLLDRLASTVKLQVINSLLPLSGATPEEILQAQKEVRQEARAEIAAKMTHWANTRATLEITTGGMA